MNVRTQLDKDSGAEVVTEASGETQQEGLEAGTNGEGLYVPS